MDIHIKRYFHTGIVITPLHLRGNKQNVPPLYIFTCFFSNKILWVDYISDVLMPISLTESNITAKESTSYR